MATDVKRLSSLPYLSPKQLAEHYPALVEGFAQNPAGLKEALLSIMFKATSGPLCNGLKKQGVTCGMPSYHAFMDGMSYYCTSCLIVRMEQLKTALTPKLLKAVKLMGKATACDIIVTVADEVTAPPPAQTVEEAWEAVLEQAPMLHAGGPPIKSGEPLDPHKAEAKNAPAPQQIAVDTIALGAGGKLVIVVPDKLPEAEMVSFAFMEAGKDPTNLAVVARNGGFGLQLNGSDRYLGLSFSLEDLRAKFAAFKSKGVDLKAKDHVRRGVFEPPQFQLIAGCAFPRSADLGIGQSARIPIQ